MFNVLNVLAAIAAPHANKPDRTPDAAGGSHGERNAESQNEHEKDSAEAAFQLALADPTERDLLSGEERDRMRTAVSQLGGALRQVAVALTIMVPAAVAGVIGAAIRWLIGCTLLRRARRLVAREARPAPATEAEHTALAAERLLTSRIIGKLPGLRRAIMRALGATRSPYCGAITLKVAARTHGGKVETTAGGLKRPKTHVIIGLACDPAKQPALTWRVRRFELAAAPGGETGEVAELPERWREVTAEGETSLIGVEAALTSFFTDSASDPSGSSNGGPHRMNSVTP